MDRWLSRFKLISLRRISFLCVYVYIYVYNIAECGGGGGGAEEEGGGRRCVCLYTYIHTYPKP